MVLVVWTLAVVLAFAGCDCDSGGDPEPSDAGPGDAFVVPDGGTDAFVPETDAGTDAGTDAPMTPDAGGCPDLTGMYAGVSSTGECGSWDMMAIQAIVDGKSGVECEVFFQSNTPKRIPGVNGDATIGADGSFSDAQLTLGTGSAIDGCSGTWDDAAEELTITCPADPMACEIVIHRTGPIT
jgi:hypothetical protein